MPGRTESAGSGLLSRYVPVFGLALAARLAAIVALERVPLWRTPSLDSLQYLLLADQVRDLAWPAYAPHAPGYPALVAALLALHCSITGVRVVQAGLGALSCALAARLAARTLDARAFLPTGILMAIYGPLVVTDVAILAEGPFLLVLMVALTLAVESRGRARRWIASGVAVGAAAMIRPTALVLLPVFAGIVVWQSRGRVTAWRSIVGMLAGTAVVLAPLVWHNWRQGHVVDLQGWGGMNVYIGNAPHGTGRASFRPGPAWDELEGAAGRAGASTLQAAEGYYLQRTLAEIREAPVSYLRLLGEKAIWLTQADELRDSHSFYFFVSEVPPLGWLPGFGVLIALAAVGLVESGRRTLLSPWLAGYIVGMALTCLFLVVGSRYRLPLVPALTIFAGAGMTWLADAVRLRQRQALVSASVLGCGVFLIAHARVDPGSHVFAEEWTLTAEGLVRDNDLAGAEAACRRAIEIDPQSAFALDELGWVQFLEGRPDLARSTLGRAAAVGPMYARAWYHLGHVEQQAGNHQAALEAFRRSLAVAPERLEVVEALGQELLATNAPSEARPLLQKVADRSPEDGTAHFGLALVALDEGRAADALAEATTTTRLLPTYGRAWTLLARTAVADNRSDLAQQALSTAEQLGSDKLEVLAGRVKILLLRGDRNGAETLVQRAAAGDASVASMIWRDVASW